jgi:hypothetical protein
MRCGVRKGFIGSLLQQPSGGEIMGFDLFPQLQGLQVPVTDDG